MAGESFFVHHIILSSFSIVFYVGPAPSLKALVTCVNTLKAGKREFLISLFQSSEGSKNFRKEHKIKIPSSLQTLFQHQSDILIPILRVDTFGDF